MAYPCNPGLFGDRLKSRFSFIDDECDRQTNWRITNIPGLVNKSSGVVEDIARGDLPRFTTFSTNFKSALKNNGVFVPGVCMAIKNASRGKFD